MVPTEYQQSKYRNGLQPFGWLEEEVAPEVYIVRFVASMKTSGATTEMYAKFRAYEHCLEKNQLPVIYRSQDTSIDAGSGAVATRVGNSVMVSNYHESYPAHSLEFRCEHPEKLELKWAAFAERQMRLMCANWRLKDVRVCAGYRDTAAVSE